MKNLVLKTYQRFCDHHDMDRPLLQWFGLVGFLLFPSLYLLRQSNSALANLYDDFTLRATATVLCLCVALRQWWPSRFKPLYLPFAYFTAFYSLAFWLSYTMLQNQGGTPSVVNMIIGAATITLLADWRNTLVMLSAGYVSSTAIFFAISPNPHIPTEFAIAALGTLVVVITGTLSHQADKLTCPLPAYQQI